MAEIRRATLHDADAIAQIHVFAYERALGDVVHRAVLEAASKQRRPMWDALLSAPPRDQAVFVAEGERVLGFVSAGRDRDPTSDPSKVGELYALFVEPSRWRAGIGGTLHDCALEHLRSLALEQARLWVLDANKSPARCNALPTAIARQGANRPPLGANVR